MINNPRTVPVVAWSRYRGSPSKEGLPPNFLPAAAHRNADKNQTQHQVSHPACNQLVIALLLRSGQDTTSNTAPAIFQVVHSPNYHEEDSYLPPTSNASALQDDLSSLDEDTPPPSPSGRRIHCMVQTAHQEAQHSRKSMSNHLHRHALQDQRCTLEDIPDLLPNGLSESTLCSTYELSDSRCFPYWKASA